MSCPYAALGVQRGAGIDEIKRAYRALVVEHHPDKHTTAPQAQQAAAATRFKTIQEAYQLLSDDRKRSAYEAARASGRGPYSAYGHAGVNTDWTTSSGYARGRSTAGYTSRLSRWEYLRRRASQGMRSFDQPLHIGLALLFVGGVVLFDTAYTSIWEARNKGKRFEDIQAAKQQAAAAAAAAAAQPAASDTGQSGSEDAPGGGGGGGGGVRRSAWLDSMRGREVKGQQQASVEPASAIPRDVDKAVLLRASPAGQMGGHRG